jgi:uncharacterized protein
MKYHLRFAIYLIVVMAFSRAFAVDSVAFFRAIGVDNVSGVKALLARGQDPNAPGEKGQTPLYMALREDSQRVLEALLSHPAIQVDGTNAAQETPLMMAAIRGNLPAAKLLLAKGAAVNREGWTPLHYAASGPETQMVALLIERGAQLEAESPNRTTPLMMAARYGTEDATLLLLAKGANPKARNDLGLDAAAFAKQVGRDSLAAKLEQAAR